MKSKLSLSRAVALLSARSGLGYSILDRGSEWAERWAICQLTFLGILEYSEKPVCGSNDLAELFRKFYPDLRKHPDLDCCYWHAQSYKRRKYVGGECTCPK